MGQKEFLMKRIAVKYLFPVVLLFYALRNVARGVDLWDGGYNYANFTYGGLKYMDAMWYFATWLSNVTGSLIIRLPFGHTMIGMNVYTGLLQGGIAVLAYWFCLKRLHLPFWAAAVGEFLALSLCWAPYAVLYNYLTYGIMLLGVVLLYRGLTTGRAGDLVLAGVVLGLNVGVRFPNLVQAGFILALWYHSLVLRKEKPAKTLSRTGWCVLGYMGALIFFVLLIAAIYGLDSYFGGIRDLFGISDTAPDYSAGFLLFSIVETYVDSVSTYWLKRFVLLLAAETAVWLVFPQHFYRRKQILTVILTTGFFWYIVRKGYCTPDYAAYQAVFYPAIFWILAGILLCLGLLFKKEAAPEDKLQALLVLLVIYITPLGSNNAMYACINNLFLTAPWILDQSWKFMWEKAHPVCFPLRVMAAACSVLLCVQGAGFGSRFVCECAAGARDLAYEITEIPVLKGMHTGQESGQELETLYRYLQTNGLLDKTCILYGDIPGLSYYMQLAPAMNIWGDLLSYSPDRMRADLKEIEAGTAAGMIPDGQIAAEQLPVVIVHTKYAEAKEDPTETQDDLNPTVKEKLDELYIFMHNNGYRRAEDLACRTYAVYLR